MPAYARKEKMNPSVVESHHCWSRCVGGAYLHGYDRVSGREFSYRRQWLVSLSEYLASVFAVEVGGENFLSNHFHGIYRNRPDIARGWSDEEVCWRWKLAWPKFVDSRWLREPTDEEINAMLLRGQESPAYIEQLRTNLANISWFQSRLKQKIAWIVNRDAPKSQQKRGHHWEARYGNRRLNSDNEVLVAFLYNDLQQVAAGAADSVEASDYSSIQRQIQSQAHETYQRVHGRHPSGRDEDLEEVEQIAALYSNCSLAPIRADGPLLTTPEVTVPESELVLPAGYYFEQQLPARECQSDGGQGDVAELEVPLAGTSESVADTTSTPEASSAMSRSLEASTAAAQEGSDSSRRNTRIHQRLRKQQRRRASRCSILNLPWEKYYELLKRAEQAHLDARTDNLMAEPSEIEASITERLQAPCSTADGNSHERVAPEDQPGAVGGLETSSTWLERVRGFTQWIHSFAGELPEELAAHVLPKTRGDPNSPTE